MNDGNVIGMLLGRGATLAAVVGLALLLPVVRIFAQPLRTPATVLSVIDGDTIEVSVNGARERVRYIGIDTPETLPDRPPACHGPEASIRNRQLVGDQTVQLESDLTDRDQYGRLLRYVWVGETFVNAQLLFEGYAQVTTYPPDVRYVDLYRSLQRQARESARGAWSACPGRGPREER